MKFSANLEIFLLAAASLLLAHPARAVDITTTRWNGGTTVWGTAGNWSGGTPTTAVSAKFDALFISTAKQPQLGGGCPRRDSGWRPE